MPEIFRAENIIHRFTDGEVGLDGANLCASDGEFLVLAGKNGSGKSLLARHLVGLAKPESGSITCRGIPVFQDLLAARRTIGLVFQDADAQIIGQTLLEDVSFGPSNLGLPRQEIESRSINALALVGLGGMETRRPDSLSGGERKCLAIAGVLAFGPCCLLLDEPFANLDLCAIRMLLSVVTSLHSGGRTIVLITHELEKTLAHATRLAVMENGKTVYDGNPSGLDAQRYEPLGLMNPFRYGKTLADLTWLQ